MAPDDSRFESEFLPYQIVGPKPAKGSPANLHRWWSRMPQPLARIMAFLALTEGQSSTKEFIEDLGATPPSSAIISKAQVRARDAQWRWISREIHRHHADKTSLEHLEPPEDLKVLDPFAGGGSIPLETLRLGCRTYAGDLSPVSYHILRATLDYPAAYAAADPAVPGSSPKCIWIGLSIELKNWANQLQRCVLPRIAPLFPGTTASSTGHLMKTYVWFQAAHCQNPECHAEFPIRSTLPIFRRGGKARQLRFTLTGTELAPEIVDVSAPEGESNVKTIVCPACGTKQDLEALFKNHASRKQTILGTTVRREGRNKVYDVTSREHEASFAALSAEHQARLEELLSEEFAERLTSDLPTRLYADARRWGHLTFADLFTPRQLLVALEYVAGIRQVRGEMRAAGLPDERVNALSTYLAFFLTYLVDHNSMLCRWQVGPEDGAASFQFLTGTLPEVFVEREPRALFDQWLSRIIPSLDEPARLPRIQEAYLGSASHLPFENDFFDAIVTDPPYFDRVPYGDLDDFFWAWEFAILGETTPEIAEGSGQDVIQTGRGDARSLYVERLQDALREAFRVLKPGRILAIYLTAQSREGFNEWVAIAQQAGFDLADVKRLETFQIAQEDPRASFLVQFRKPFVTHIINALQADATGLLERAESGKGVLYVGLAELLQGRLEEEDVAGFAPPGAKGSKTDRLMEALAYCDPRELLKGALGTAGLRQLAREIGVLDSSTDVQNPLDAILSCFGFVIPSPAAVDGVTQTLVKLRGCEAQIRHAAEKSTIRGSFMDGCATVESLIRLTLWGWARLMFGPEYKNEILETLRRADSNKSYQLDRLTFGNIAVLFRDLPDVIAASSKTEGARGKLGRNHVYPPRGKKTKYSNRLDELVAVRNSVEHDKDSYWTASSEGVLMEDLASTLRRATQLLADLARDEAIPRIATPVQEIRDRWGRLTYRLLFDDGTDFEVYFSAPIRMDCGYLYFGAGSNPRPVDPLVLELESLRG